MNKNVYKNYLNLITENMKDISGTKAKVDTNKNIIYFNGIEYRIADYLSNKFGDESYYVYSGNNKRPLLQVVKINNADEWAVFEYSKGFEIENQDKDLYIAIAKMLEKI